MLLSKYSQCNKTVSKLAMTEGCQYTLHQENAHAGHVIRYAMTYQKRLMPVEDNDRTPFNSSTKWAFCQSCVSILLTKNALDSSCDNGDGYCV